MGLYNLEEGKLKLLITHLGGAPLDTQIGHPVFTMRQAKKQSGIEHRDGENDNVSSVTVVSCKEQCE